MRLSIGALLPAALLLQPRAPTIRLCASDTPEVPPSKDVGALTYLSFPRSRGEPVQMVAKYEGLDMPVNFVSMEEWGKMKSEKIPFLPCLTQPDGAIMLEVGVILKHLATVGGKLVIDAKQDELCTIANTRPIHADPMYNLPGGAVAMGWPTVEEWIPMVAPVYEDLATKLGDGPFFAGEKPGYAEAYIFHNLDNHFAFAKAELTAAVSAEAMGKLEAFYNRFAALDGIREYLAERPTTWGMPGSVANPSTSWPTRT